MKMSAQQNEVIKKAIKMFHGMKCCGTHPEQIFQHERHSGMKESRFLKWWWDTCYAEARCQENATEAF